MGVASEAQANDVWWKVRLCVHNERGCVWSEQFLDVCRVVAVKVLNDWIYFLWQVDAVTGSSVTAGSMVLICTLLHIMYEWDAKSALKMKPSVEISHVWRCWVVSVSLKSSLGCSHTCRISLNHSKFAQLASSGELLILDGPLASDWDGLSLCKLRIDNQEVHICIHLDRSATWREGTMSCASYFLAFSHIQSHYCLVTALLLPSAWIALQ